MGQLVASSPGLALGHSREFSYKEIPLPLEVQDGFTHTSVTLDGTVEQWGLNEHLSACGLSRWVASPLFWWLRVFKREHSKRTSPNVHALNKPCQ